MSLNIAYDKALKEFAAVQPYVAAAKSNTIFDGRQFKLDFFNRQFFITHPDGKVSEPGKAAPPQYLQLILFHYLLTADGTATADQWIAYRHLPGAFLFEKRFENMVIGPLVKAFGKDLEGFIKAGIALGGISMSRTGDAAFRFLALPAIPMACLLYLGDEEVSPSVNVLFDAGASYYLPTEDLSLVGTYLKTAMVNAGKK